MLLRRFGVVVALLGATVAAERVAAKEFNFADPKGVNTIAFVLDSKIEPIMGLATGISGTVEFDPSNPTETRGTIVLDAKSVECAHNGMTRVLHGEDWIDVKTYPTIEFTFKQVKAAESGEDGAVELTVVGEITLKGVTKELEIPVSATYLRDQLGNRLRGKNGDLLVLRSTFSVNRKDFGIKPEMDGTVVAEDIELRVSIVGYWAEG